MLYRNRGLGDTRASVIPIGFILVVGILTLMLYVFQSSTVPVLNQEAEVTTHRMLTTDMYQFDSAVARTATTGVGQSVVFRSNVDYSFQFVPPIQPDTEIRTGTPHDITFSNAVRAEGGSETGWDGSDAVYNTRPLAIVPDYQQHRNAQQIQSEHGIVHFAENSDPQNTTVVVDGQSLISGNRLTFIRLTGDVSVTRRADMVVGLRPVGSAESVRLTNATGESVTVTLETSLSESQWESLLKDEQTTNGGHVVEFNYESAPTLNTVTITLEPDIDYRLKIYEVELETTRISG